MRYFDLVSQCGCNAGRRYQQTRSSNYRSLVGIHRSPIWSDIIPWSAITVTDRNWARKFGVVSYGEWRRSIVGPREIPAWILTAERHRWRKRVHFSVRRAWGRHVARENLCHDNRRLSSRFVYSSMFSSMFSAILLEVCCLGWGGFRPNYVTCLDQSV